MEQFTGPLMAGYDVMTWDCTCAVWWSSGLMSEYMLPVTSMLLELQGGKEGGPRWEGGGGRPP